MERTVMFRVDKEEYSKLVQWKAKHMNRPWKDIVFDMYRRAKEGKIETQPLPKSRKKRAFRTIMFKCTEEEHKQMLELKEMFSNPSWPDILLYFAEKGY